MGAKTIAEPQPEEVATTTFLTFVRRNQQRLLSEYGSPIRVCEALLACDLENFSKLARSAYESADRDNRNYLVASTYALLIGPDRRRTLSAYFTPPKLCNAVLDAIIPNEASRAELRVLDPACGGGAFLVPVARRLIENRIADGVRPSSAARQVIKNLHGVEVEPGLARLSRLLLANLLRNEFGVEADESCAISVQRADTLQMALPGDFDLVVGNPPYGRVGAANANSLLAQAGLASVGGHTNYYALFLLKGLDALRPGGRLVFVLPTSFVAGPYFAGLRREILSRARVLRIDVHRERENLFVGAVQDVCVLLLERCADGKNGAGLSYDVGVIDDAGAREVGGKVKVPADGAPWGLPGQLRHGRQLGSIANGNSKCWVLREYGYRVRVGKVVPTRERDRLRMERSAGSIPLLWASAVRPDGSFNAKGGEHARNPLWYLPENSLVTYRPRACVLVQRTSNRDQARRLNAAAVPLAFLEKHDVRGFVAENHVIILEAETSRPKVSPTLLAAILNSRVVNDRFSVVCGSFSVSAKLLERLVLPSPEELPARGAADFETMLRSAYKMIDGVLVRDGADRS